LSKRSIISFLPEFDKYVFIHEMYLKKKIIQKKEFIIHKPKGIFKRIIIYWI